MSWPRTGARKVSLREQKEVVDKMLPEQVERVLKVPKEAIEDLTGEGAIHIVANAFQDTKGFINYNPSYRFNPIEKIVELYEALAKSEKEKKSCVSDCWA